MTTFHTIVVGCDGSEGVADAVALAQQLRDPERGRLVLVAVFPFYRNFAIAPLAYTDWLAEAAEADLAAAERFVGADVPYERQLTASPSAGAGLTDVAESVHADLIVLGPSHQGAAGRLTGRATIQRMLHGAPCAITIAAKDQAQRFAGGGTIAVAYDDSDEARFALDTAYAIATRTDAMVRICTALEPVPYATGFTASLPDPRFDEQREQQARERLDELEVAAPEGVVVETRLQWGPPAATMLALAEGVDLLVAGSRGYGPLHRVLAGGVSSGLLANGTVPVLVTPRVAAKAAAALITR